MREAHIPAAATILAFAHRHVGSVPHHYIKQALDNFCKQLKNNKNKINKELKLLMWSSQSSTMDGLSDTHAYKIEGMAKLSAKQNTIGLSQLCRCI